MSLPPERGVFLLLHFTAIEIMVKECIIEKTFNDKQLGRHRFLQNHGVAATPSDLNGIVSSSRQVIKSFFTCCKPRIGPELRDLLS